MDATERFQAVFDHDTSNIDRLPTFFLGISGIGTFYKEWLEYINDHDLADEDVCIIPGYGDMTLRKWIGADNVCFSLPHLYNYPEVKLPDDHPLFKKEAKQTINWNGAIRTLGTMHGHAYTWYEGGFFESLEAREDFYNEYGVPWDDEFSPTPKQVKFFKEKVVALKKSGLFTPFVGGGAVFHRVWDGIGTGSPFFAKLYRKHPSALKKWIKQHLKIVKRAWKLQLETGEVDFMMIWDDTGQKNRSIAPPKVYGEFFKPGLAELCKLAHKHGAKVLMHSCGYQEEFLDHYIDAGLDALQSIEITANNNLGRIREKVGDKLILVGGIDASDVLSFGTDQDIVKHVHNQVNVGTFSRSNSMYIPGPTHDILDCPFENVNSFRESLLWEVREWVKT